MLPRSGACSIDPSSLPKESLKNLDVILLLSVFPCIAIAGRIVHP